MSFLKNRLTPKGKKQHKDRNQVVGTSTPKSINSTKSNLKSNHTPSNSLNIPPKINIQRNSKVYVDDGLHVLTPDIVSIRSKRREGSSDVSVFNPFKKQHGEELDNRIEGLEDTNKNEWSSIDQGNSPNTFLEPHKVHDNDSFISNNSMAINNDIRGSKKSIALEEHLAKQESTIPNDNHGLLSTIVNAAHNAATHIISNKSNDMISHPPAQQQKSSTPDHNDTSFIQHLDSLLFGQQQQQQEQQQQQQQLPQLPLQQQQQQQLQRQINQNNEQDLDGTNTPDSTNHTKSIAREIYFEPIRKKNISTMGKGELRLDDFTDIQNQFQSHIPTAQHSPELNPITIDDKKIIPQVDIVQPTPIPVNSPTKLTFTNSDRELVGSRPYATPSQRIVDGSKSFTEGVDSNRSTSPSGIIKRALSPISSRQRRKSVSSLNGDSNLNMLTDDDLSRSTSNPSIFELTNINYSNEKRNNELHNIFKNLSKNERLIDDFGCAYQKDILIQGRLYLTDRHILFKSNILGWITNIVIPLKEIVRLEKKTTAGVFRNGISIQTLHSKHGFASFISRDSTFDLITNIWNQLIRSSIDPDEFSRDERINESASSDEDDDFDQREEEEDGYSSDELDEEDLDDTLEDEHDSNNSIGGPLKHSATEPDHKEVTGETKITETIIDGPLTKVYLALFGDDTTKLKNILLKQNNKDLSEITGFSGTEGTKKREYQYVKPLSGPVGPKETLCEVIETLDHFDLNKFVQVTQSTKSPDVPSGNSFTVITTIYLSWGPNNSTKISVYTYVNWTGKSWIKSAIESGTISGQKDSLKVLTDELRSQFATVDQKRAKSSDEEEEGEVNLPTVGPGTHPPTSNDYKSKNGDVVITEESFNAPLGTVYSLLFGSDTSYLKSILTAQKNFDISTLSEFKDKKRNYNYIKPLNSSVGPKQTKCEITETIETSNFDKNVLVLQKTATPDVPSGNSFTTDTSFYLSWGKNNSTKLFVVTFMNWTGKSWLKGPIEKGAIDGQKEAIGILVREIKSILSTNGKKKKKVKVKKRPTIKTEESEFYKELTKNRKDYEFLSFLKIPYASSFFLFFIVTILLWIVGKFHVPTQDNGIVTGINKIDIDGKTYIIMPALEDLTKIETLRDEAGFEIWDWINERSGARPKRAKDSHDQQLQELLTIMERKANTLRNQLENISNNPNH
ncbi:hypothetical protein WICMUC_003379 [Wickerhamomyces mucosus]|uniref:VASt domain-containing protein n=1 Tax=Wickerhamomyces mucosus TaxID=1378264 RepID=A0A9P8PL74_9ASCO|nr:hypothetical protein WICMUC_003379 [Wickerhamomyces mucosus]